MTAIVAEITAAALLLWGVCNREKLIDFEGKIFQFVKMKGHKNEKF